MPRHLNTSARYQKLSRNISGVPDAVVELITNSDDAYHKGIRGGVLAADVTRSMDVCVNYHDHTVTLTDQAIGMEGGELDAKMSVIGAYTSEEGVRGYFSRGSKDIIAIGDVTFTTVFNEKVSELTLGWNGLVSVVRKNVVITPEERLSLDIPVCGTKVCVSLLKSVRIPTVDNMALTSQCVNLRDIFSDPNTHVQMRVIAENGIQIISTRMTYVAPAQKPVPMIDVKFAVPGWPGSVVDFTLYELEKAEPDVPSIYRTFGVLVCTPTTIHANESFSSQVDSNPMYRLVTGRATTTYIDTLMYQYEWEDATEDNLVPVINSDRTGLNRKHRFIIDMYRHMNHMIIRALSETFVKRLEGDEMLMDISQILLEHEDDTSFSFLQKVGTLFAYTDGGNISRSIRYLDRNTGAILEEAKESKFTFSKPVDMLKVEKGVGDIDRAKDIIRIRFVEDPAFKLSVRYYQERGTLVIEINRKDYLLSQCLVYQDDGRIVVKCEETFRVNVIRLISKSISFFMYERYLDTLSVNEIALMEDHDRRTGRDEMEYKLLERVSKIVGADILGSGLGEHVR